MKELENSGCLPTIFERGPNGTYSIRVANIDGCISWGDTIEEGLLNIREALNLHLKGMHEDGIPIPPYDLKTIQESLEPAESLILICGSLDITVD